MKKCPKYLHDQLMGARHQSESVGMIEGFRDVLTEGVAGTSGRDPPPAAVIGVRPQQVTHRALKQKPTAQVNCTVQNPKYKPDKWRLEFKLEAQIVTALYAQTHDGHQMLLKVWLVLQSFAEHWLFLINCSPVLALVTILYIKQ